MNVFEAYKDLVLQGICNKCLGCTKLEDIEFKGLSKCEKAVTVEYCDKKYNQMKIRENK